MAFQRGIRQGEMLPLFILVPRGGAELVIQMWAKGLVAKLPNSQSHSVCCYSSSWSNESMLGQLDSLCTTESG